MHLLQVRTEAIKHMITEKETYFIEADSQWMQCQQGMEPGSAKRITGVCVVHILLSTQTGSVFPV